MKYICKINHKIYERTEQKIMDTAITKEMYKEMGIDEKVFSFGQEIAESLKERFEEIDRVAEYNQLKVVHAMQQCRASEACLYASSGYGYNDVGRDTPKRSTQLPSIRNLRWYVHRLPAEPMHLLLHLPEICARETNCSLR